jgi:uncharacterized protein YjbJ (UPF0337 family)
MNTDTIKGKWNQWKGAIQKQWGKITGDELEQTKGELNSISGLIQEKYGLAKDEADRKVRELMKGSGLKDDDTFPQSDLNH